MRIFLFLLFLCVFFQCAVRYASTPTPKFLCDEAETRFSRARYPYDMLQPLEQVVRKAVSSLDTALFAEPIDESKDGSVSSTPADPLLKVLQAEFSDSGAYPKELVPGTVSGDLGACVLVQAGRSFVGPRKLHSLSLFASGFFGLLELYPILGTRVQRLDAYACIV